MHKRLTDESNQADESIKAIETRKIELNGRINELGNLRHEEIKKELDLLLHKEK